MNDRFLLILGSAFLLYGLFGIIVQSVIAVFVTCILGTMIIISYFVLLKRRKKEKEKHIKKVEFSVSDYIARRERECLKLLEEREREGPYIITLWLGLDGLRLNTDGTTEWVKRTAKKDTTTEIQNRGCRTLPDFVLNDMQNCSGTITCAHTESRTLETLIRSNIQSQTQALQLQNLQMQLAMLSAKPAVPVYLAYSCVSPYLGGYNPCYNPYYNPLFGSEIYGNCGNICK